MNKIDLDISKYTSNELRDIFNIDANMESGEIPSHMNTFKKSVITDNNLELGKKDEITKFIDDVVDKLATALARTDTSQTFSSPYNAMVQETGIDHPIIEDPNAIAGQNARIYEGRNVSNIDYPPGYINPINVKTIKRYINIDSRFRSSYYNTASSHFHYDMPETFRKVVNLRVSSFNIPLTIYGINNENRCFNVDASLVDISNGNYHTKFAAIVYKDSSVNDIESAIQGRLDTELGANAIVYTIEPITGKSHFDISGGDTSYNIYFNKDCCGYDDLATPLPLKLGWLLGFRGGHYNLIKNRPLISEGIPNIAVPRYIYMCINDYTNAGSNNFVALYNESSLSPHIIARIQYQELVQSKGIYNYGQDDDTFEATREYFGPVDLKKLEFTFIDEYGRIIDFNHMDWSCTLAFDILYD